MSTVTGTGSITPKDVTLVAGPVSKTYNGNTDYSVTQADLDTLSGQLITGDTVSGASISYTDKNVSRDANGAVLSNKTITLDSVTLSDGNDGGNYTVTRQGNSASVITPKTLSASAIAAVQTTYGTAAGTGAVSLTGVEGGDVVNASASLVSAQNSSSGNLKAGSYLQTTDSALTGSQAGNYTLPSFTTASANYVVNKLALTGAAIAGVTTTYATSADAGAVSFTNVQGADKVTSVASIVDTATSTSGNLKAGSYKQTATAISGDDAANYSFAGITTTDKNYVVDKLALTGAAIAGVTTTYATSADAGAVSFTNVQGTGTGTDKVTSVASIVDASNSANISTSGNLKAGSYKQTATAISGDDAANYSFAGITTTDKNYVVEKLALTGAAIAGVTTTYATSADAGAVSFTNVQGTGSSTDKVTSVASIVDVSNSTSGNLKAGSYKQTATAITGDDAENYSFVGLTTTDKNYVVDKLALTGAAIAGVTTTYATSADAGAVSFTNVQGTGANTDKVTSVASIVDVSNSTSGNLKAGSYNQTATAISGDDAANYSFAGITTTDKNYVVDKLALTGAAIAGVTTTYATSADAGAVSFTNVQSTGSGTDQVTSVASIVDVSNSTSGNLKAGSYNQTATAISGDDAANYSFAGITTTDKNYVVNKLALTGAAIAGVTTTYATAADAGVVSFTNVQGTDKVTSVASIVDTATSTSGNLKAGSYKQTATAISGDDAANYSFAGITTTDKNYVVDKLALTGAAIAGVTTTYATSADAGAVSFTNVQGTGTGTDKVTSVASIVDASNSANISTSGNLKAGSYKQTATAISGDDAANYSFAGITTTDKNYVVEKLALTGAAIAGVTTTYATAADVGAVSFTNVQSTGSGTDKVTSVASIVDTATSTSGNLKAGSYKQTATAISGDDAENYSFAGITTTDKNYVVDKLALTGAAIAGVTTTYATAADVGAVSFTNVQSTGSGTDKVTSVASIVDTATSTSGHLKAGSYKQTATAISGDDAENYSFAGITTTDKNYVVDKLALTGAAIAGVTTTYATAADAGAVSFTNVQGTGSSTDKVTSVASIVDTATSTSGHLKAGSYKQTATAISGDDAANYSFAGITTTDKNYVVDKLALTGAAIAGVTTTYATAADAGAVSFTNVQGTGANTDKVTSVASIVDVSNSTSGNLKAGSYNQTATGISGDDAANYSFAGITTTDKNYVVDKLALTGAAIAGVTTTYATSADAGAVSFTNVQGTDQVTSVASIVDTATSTSGHLKAGSYKQTATAISGDDASNYSFAGITTTDKNYVVNKLALTGAAIAGVTTTYATAADAGAVSFTNVQSTGTGTDKVTSVASIVDTATSTSGNLKAGSYNQTATAISGDDAANYSFAGITTTDKNYVVDKLALTGAAITGVTTTYATAADAGAVSFTNVQGTGTGTDKVTSVASIVDVSNSTSGNLKAGSYKQTATAITGDDAENYSFVGLTTTDKNYVVNKLALTGAAIAGVTTTYATAADAGAVSFTNVQGTGANTDKVTSVASIVDTATSTSGNLKAGSYKQIATAISGDDADNYSFAGITTTDKNYVVDKLALTGAAIAGVTTTYATSADAGAVSFTNVQSTGSGTDKVTSIASIVDTSVSTSGNLKAGSYKQTATAITGDDADNYSFAGLTTTDKNYVVNKLALTGAAIAGVTTTYATAANAGAVSFTNVQGTDKVTSVASIVDTATSTSGHLKAGTYKQTATAITGDDADNYSFAGLTTTDKNYVVDKLALTGAAIAGVTTTYATAADAGAVSFTNVQGTGANTDKVTSVASIVDVSNSTSGHLKAGSYKQTATAISGDDAENYSFAGLTTTDKNYVVDKLALTGAAIAGVTTTYATAADAGAVSFTNVQSTGSGTDQVTSVASIVDVSTSTSGNLKAGSYNQTATAISGDDAANYSFAGITTTDKNYVVDKLALTGAAIAGVTTTYATAADAGAVSFTNVQGTGANTDKVTSVASIVDVSNSTSGNLKAGSYNQTATAINGDDAANYSFAGITTTDKNYVVNKLALTGAAIAGVTTTYATAADAGAVSFTNVQGTDKVTSVASIVDTATSTSGKLKAGSYKQTATAISGDDAANYSFAGITTTDKNYVVEKLALTGAAIAGVTTTYATAANVGAVSFTNVQGTGSSTDKVTSVASIVDVSNSTSGHLKAGSYNQTATAISGDDAANYSFAGITTTDKNYVVDKLALTGAAIAGVTTTYATSADAGAVSFTNVQGTGSSTDKVTSVASIVDVSNSTSGHLKAGSYNQTATAISGDDAANYSFAGITTTDKNYVVDKLALTGAAIAGVTTTYATSADAGAVSFTNVQGTGANTDKVTSVASIVDVSNSTSGNLKAGSYKQTATAISGDDAENYSFAGITTTDKNYVVDKLALTGAAIAGVTTTYATAADAGAVSFTNVQGTGTGTDKVTSVASIVDASNSANISTSGHLKAGSYKQTATAISGDDADNYSFAGITTTDKNYVVNKLALTGAAIAGVTTTYATSADAGAVSFTNVQGTGSSTDKVTSVASIVDVSNSTSGNLKAGSYKQTATAITGDDADNYSFVGLTTTDKNYVVNKLALTGAAIAGVTTTYATAADAGAVSFTNVQSTGTGTDQVTSVASIVDVSNSTSGNLKAGSYKQTATAISGDDADNYSFAGITTTDKNYVVNKLALTGAAIAGVTTTYATSGDAGAVSFTNVQGTGANTDKVTSVASIVDVSNSTSGNLKAGSYKQTATAISGDDAENYSFAGITTTDKNYVVDKLALTGAAIAGVTTTYATAADAGAVSFTNVQSTGTGTDKVTSVASIVDASNSANISTSGHLKAGSYKQTATAITGDDAENYSFVGLTTTDKNYVVNKLALTGAAIAGVTTTYATAADAGAVSFTNVQSTGSGTDQVTSVASIVDTATSNSGHLKAGSYNQTATAITGDDAENYSFVGLTTTDKNYVVNKLALTGAAIAGVTTTYGTITASGAVTFSNVMSGDIVTPAGSTLVAEARSSSGHLKAGSYAQSVIGNLTGKDAVNYSFTGMTTDTANYVVNKRALTGAAIADVTTIYGTSAVTGAVRFGNVLGADQIYGATATLVTPSYSSSNNLKVGSYAQSVIGTLTGKDADNYSFTGLTTSSANYTVNKLALTGPAIAGVTATYGSPIVTGAVSFGNVLTNDVVTPATATLVAPSYSSSNTLKVGNYIQTVVGTLTGADADNYSFGGYTACCGAARYVVTPKTLVVKVDAMDKVYDSNNLATLSQTTSADIIGADKVNFANTSVLFDNKNVARDATGQVINKAVTVRGLSISGDDAANYVLDSTVVTGSAKITPKLATINGTATEVMFNGLYQWQQAATTQGFIAGDDIQLKGLATGLAIGTYNSTLNALGSDVNNYVVTVNDNQLAITPAAASAPVVATTPVGAGGMPTTHVSYMGYNVPTQASAATSGVSLPAPYTQTSMTCSATNMDACLCQVTSINSVEFCQTPNSK
ncbi:YDG domain-containing protein [Limnohabitans sp. DM1]|uniref:beta strand repeat-containing protein n=1 Tax=Limnohabitans sp. DM1 TaxID=1597955 RepID=UPI001E42663B|nr:YDG domain-containing protein [Limnohabitans sp. DM1]